MSENFHTNQDPELICDFFDEFVQMQELVINTVNTMNLNGTNNSTNIDAIFRSIHSIKSNLYMISLQKLADLLHHLENILQGLRENNLTYTASLGKLICLTLEAVKNYAQQSFNNEVIEDKVTAITQAMTNIALAKPEDKQAAIDANLMVFDAVNNQSQKLDLIFFEKLGQLVTLRLPNYHNKTKIILPLILAMNQEANKIVADIQLQAAAYVINFGLSLMPTRIHYVTKLTAFDENHIKQLPLITSSLFKFTPFWQCACDIVLQTYEQVDGNGYPSQLQDKQICDGAKIMAIAQTFAAILYPYPYVAAPSRSIIEAILEINQKAGTKFSEYWVEIFNKTAKKLYQK